MFSIAIIGPESTGKSSLAAFLAQHYSCDFIPEYAREYLTQKGNAYSIEDVVAIAQEQQRLIDAEASKQPAYLISDTEAIVNKVWSEYVFGTTPPLIHDMVQAQHFDLYLLCDIDLEWTYDPLRENPDLDERKDIFAMYQDTLKAINANYRVISGKGKERFAAAIKAIQSMETRKKHVVFLARWYPNRYDPMFGLFVQRHAETAAQHNQVSVIYVHAVANAKLPYETVRTMEHGVDTIRVYYRQGNKLCSALRFWRSCRKALKAAGPADIIHVHVLTRMGAVALWHRFLHGTPYLITEHWSRYLPGNNFGGLIRKTLTRMVVGKASMVTTVTQNLAQAMQAHGLKNPNYKVLPNIADIRLFKPHPHENPVPTLVHISCFEDKSKNISGLLHALKMLKDEDVPYKAILIGDGMDYHAMRQLADTLRLNDRIRFTGVLEGEDLVDELSSADFMVLSSNYENLPVVIVEALACGLPIVSTRVGGIAEIVNESNGLLVAPRDTTALKEAIKRMCVTYKNYDGQSLRDMIIKTNSTEKVGELLSTWYDDILKGKR